LTDNFQIDPSLSKPVDEAPGGLYTWLHANIFLIIAVATQPAEEINHKGTKNTKDIILKNNIFLCALCVLCVLCGKKMMAE
jgi:hypothetical protein